MSGHFEKYGRRAAPPPGGPFGFSFYVIHFHNNDNRIFMTKAKKALACAVVEQWILKVSPRKLLISAGTTDDMPQENASKS
jgi:hypothetical protein